MFPSINTCSSHHQAILGNQLLQSLDRSLNNMRPFPDHQQTLIPNMYHWSRKTLVTIHWTHLRAKKGFVLGPFLWLKQTHTHTHTRLMALFPGLTRWAGTRKVKPIWILLEQETVSGSGISWAICKSAPRSRQITMPAPHHSVFYRAGALPAAQPTVSKHWRHKSTEGISWLKQTMQL